MRDIYPCAIIPFFADFSGENMSRLLFALIFSLIVAGGPCCTANAADVSSRGREQRTRLALVCDHYCACWQTRYQLRRDGRDDREFRNFNLCPSGGSYNGYYRTGPSIGLGFESRFAERSYPFPF